MAWLPDGRLLLLSSQSTSRRGRRPRSRTQMVAVTFDGMRLHATAVVSLVCLSSTALGQDPFADPTRSPFDPAPKPGDQR
jgi:hypothetical protein